MNLIQKIKRKILIFRVNRALGIELFDWQIAHIFDDVPTPEALDEYRITGKTTAAVLKVLLNPKYNNSIIGRENPDKYPCESPPYYATVVRIARIYGEDGVTLMRRRLFIEKLRDTRRTLKSARIKFNNLTIRY